MGFLEVDFSCVKQHALVRFLWTEQIHIYIWVGGLIEWLLGCGPISPTMAVYQQEDQESVVTQSMRIDVSAGLQHRLRILDKYASGGARASRQRMGKSSLLNTSFI